MEDERRPGTAYPTDVIDEEWAVVAPHVTIMSIDAPRRVHDLREVCNAVRGIARQRTLVFAADHLPAIGDRSRANPLPIGSLVIADEPARRLSAPRGVRPTIGCDRDDSLPKSERPSAPRFPTAPSAN